MARHRLVVWAAVCFSAACPAGAVNLISNGGFETNGGAGFSIFSNWTTATQDTAGGGGFWAETGGNSPVNGFTVAGPTQGSFAAMTDDSGPSSSVLLQMFTVPVNAASVHLSFDYFLLIPDSSPFILPSPQTLDYTANGNEQARVDILSGTAGQFDVGAADLLTVLQTNPTDPNQYAAYASVSTDITASITPGGTYFLRFAEVDDQGALVFGVDNVQLTATLVTTPEPAGLGLMAVGLLALAGFGRRWRHR